MLLRAAHISGVDFHSFQDDFDLDKDKDFDAGDEPENNFNSVAALVGARYPNVTFKCDSFDSGNDKVAFIDKQIKSQRLVLISLYTEYTEPLTLNRKRGWHIVPVVDADDSKFTVLWVMKSNGKMDDRPFTKQHIADLHDRYPGGKEVAYLRDSSAK